MLKKAVQMMNCEKCKSRIERKAANQRFCAVCRKIVEKDRVEEAKKKKNADHRYHQAGNSHEPHTEIQARQSAASGGLRGHGPARKIGGQGSARH